MSFREKTAWICLITTILVYLPYFAYVFRLLSDAELTIGSVIGPFIAAVVFQVLFMIVAHIVFRIWRSKQEQKDERDVMIDSKAYRNAYIVLLVSAFSAVGLIFAFSIVAAPTPPGQSLIPGFVSQVLLFCFVVAETTRFLTQVVCYKRGC